MSQAWRSKARCSRLSVRAAAGGGSDPLKFALKWPNEFGDRRAEALPVSCSRPKPWPGNRLAVVAGIGTNVIAAPEGTPTPATSLAALGVHIGAEELFAALSDAWVEFRGIWDNGRGFADIAGCGLSVPQGSANGSQSRPALTTSRALSTPSMKPAV